MGGRGGQNGRMQSISKKHGLPGFDGAEKGWKDG